MSFESRFCLILSICDVGPVLRAICTKIEFILVCREKMISFENVPENVARAVLSKNDIAERVMAISACGLRLENPRDWCWLNSLFQLLIRIPGFIDRLYEDPLDSGVRYFRSTVDRLYDWSVSGSIPAFKLQCLRDWLAPRLEEDIQHDILEALSCLLELSDPSPLLSSLFRPIGERLVCPQCGIYDIRELGGFYHFEFKLSQIQSDSSFSDLLVGKCRCHEVCECGAQFLFSRGYGGYTPGVVIAMSKSDDDRGPRPFSEKDYSSFHALQIGSISIQSEEYQLSGLIRYEGNGWGGHWMYYHREFASNSWLCCNDEFVDACSVEEAFLGSSYLVYVKSSLFPERVRGSFPVSLSLQSPNACLKRLQRQPLKRKPSLVTSPVKRRSQSMDCEQENFLATPVRGSKRRNSFDSDKTPTRRLKEVDDTSPKRMFHRTPDRLFDKQLRSKPGQKTLLDSGFGMLGLTIKTRDCFSSFTPLRKNLEEVQDLPYSGSSSLNVSPVKKKGRVFSPDPAGNQVPSRSKAANFYEWLNKNKAEESEMQFDNLVRPVFKDKPSAFMGVCTPITDRISGFQAVVSKLAQERFAEIEDFDSYSAYRVTVSNILNLISYMGDISDHPFIDGLTQCCLTSFLSFGVGTQSNEGALRDALVTFHTGFVDFRKRPDYQRLDSECLLRLERAYDRFRFVSSYIVRHAFQFTSLVLRLHDSRVCRLCNKLEAIYRCRECNATFYCSSACHLMCVESSFAGCIWHTAAVISVLAKPHAGCACSGCVPGDADVGSAVSPSGCEETPIVRFEKSLFRKLRSLTHLQAVARLRKRQSNRSDRRKFMRREFMRTDVGVSFYDWLEKRMFEFQTEKNSLPKDRRKAFGIERSKVENRRRDVAVRRKRNQFVDDEAEVSGSDLGHTDHTEEGSDSDISDLFACDTLSSCGSDAVREKYRELQNLEDGLNLELNSGSDFSGNCSASSVTDFGSRGSSLMDEPVDGARGCGNRRVSGSGRGSTTGRGSGRSDNFYSSGDQYMIARRDSRMANFMDGVLMRNMVTDPSSSLYQTHVCPARNAVCPWKSCKALLYPWEIKYSPCCGNGKVFMPLSYYPVYPPDLRKLFTGGHVYSAEFLKHGALAYSKKFAMCSTGLKSKNTSSESGGLPVLQVQGKSFCTINSFIRNGLSCLYWVQRILYREEQCDNLTGRFLGLFELLESLMVKFNVFYRFFHSFGSSDDAPKGQWHIQPSNPRNGVPQLGLYDVRFNHLDVTAGGCPTMVVRKSGGKAVNIDYRNPFYMPLGHPFIYMSSIGFHPFIPYRDKKDLMEGRKEIKAGHSDVGAPAPDKLLVEAAIRPPSPRTNPGYDSAAVIHFHETVEAGGLLPDFVELEKQRRRRLPSMHIEVHGDPRINDSDDELTFHSPRSSGGSIGGSLVGVVDGMVGQSDVFDPEYVGDRSGELTPRSQKIDRNFKSQVERDSRLPRPNEEVCNLALYGGSRDYCSMRAHENYFVYERIDHLTTIFLAEGDFMSDYILSAFTKVADSGLEGLRHALAYNDSRKATVNELKGLKANERGFHAGHRNSLPRDFKDGDSYKRHQCQRMMRLVKDLGPPDLFITITGNPYWPELTKERIGGGILECSWAQGDNRTFARERPDIFSKVFEKKITDFLEYLQVGKPLGRVDAYCSVTEWQYRSNPHEHIVVWLNEADKPKTAADIDNLVSVEIPVITEHSSDAEKIVYDMVTSFHLHGPCALHNCLHDGACCKGFPKPFSEETVRGPDGEWILKRRESSPTFTKEITIDRKKQSHVYTAQYVSEYNRTLTSLLRCHCNVTLCRSVNAIIYLFGYIFKSNPTVDVSLHVKPDADAIERFSSGRVLCGNEGAHKLLGLLTMRCSHSIRDLDIELPGTEVVYFHDHDSFDDIAAKREKVEGRTMLAAYFAFNKQYPHLQIVYDEILRYAVWNSDSRTFTLRKRKVDSLKPFVESLPYISINAGERYYLKLLLLYVKSPTCWSDLYTVRCNDEVVSFEGRDQFRNTAEALGLMDGLKHIIAALDETCLMKKAKVVRSTFAVAVCSLHPQDLRDLFQRYEKSMASDLLHVYLRVNPRCLDEGENVPVEISNYCLLVIQNALEKVDLSLLDFNLSGGPLNSKQVNLDLQRLLGKQYIDPLDSGTIMTQQDPGTDFKRDFLSFTEEQRKVFEVIKERISASDDSQRNLMFLGAPAGTGKTFFLNTLIKYALSEGLSFIVVASTGVAANLLIGGATAHKTFSIPLNCPAGTSASINVKSKLAQRIRDSSLVIWDECVTVSCHVFEAVSSAFKDIMRSERHFGDKRMLFVGDFRQTMPIVNHDTSFAGGADISIKKSRFWRETEIFPPFSVNLRARLAAMEDKKASDAYEGWAQFVASVGSGSAPEGDVAGSVRLPLQNCVIGGGVEKFLMRFFNPSKFSPYDMAKHGVVTATHVDCNMLNSEVLNLLPGKAVCYDSVDSFDDKKYDSKTFLAAFNPVELPPAKLVLKEGCIVMLMRNISPKLGLCNGTKCIVTSLNADSIGLEVVSGRNHGYRFNMFRVSLETNEPLGGIQFRREQFPLHLAYATTVHKCQGQTLSKCGLYLPDKNFAHGMLYVAISRVGRPSDFSAYFVEGTKISDDDLGQQYVSVKNVICKRFLV
jgi:PIF1-like helicase/Helitron helicase-like domain at N-terminus